jgi:hypothetical protein
MTAAAQAGTLLAGAESSAGRVVGLVDLDQALRVLDPSAVVAAVESGLTRVRASVGSSNPLDPARRGA